MSRRALRTWRREEEREREDRWSAPWLECGESEASGSEAGLGGGRGEWRGTCAWRRREGRIYMCRAAWRLGEGRASERRRRREIEEY